MRPTLFHSQKTSAREGGFTIIELSITMGILLIVMGALLSVFAAAQRTQSFATNRSETLDEMRLTMAQMTKDIRQATLIAASSGPSRIEMDAYVLGVTQHVIYEATGTSLTRSIGSTTEVLLQTRLVSTSVFTYTPAVTGAQVVAITLQVSPRNAPNTVLELMSEIRLRNSQ
jgi:type II secretory pathway component PulJ